MLMNFVSIVSAKLPCFGRLNLYPCSRKQCNKSGHVHYSFNPSYAKPTPDTKGEGGGSAPPAISKTDAAMNMKFCMVSETSLNI